MSNWTDFIIPLVSIVVILLVLFPRIKPYLSRLKLPERKPKPEAGTADDGPKPSPDKPEEKSGLSIPGLAKTILWVGFAIAIVIVLLFALVSLGEFLRGVQQQTAPVSAVQTSSSTSATPVVRVEEAESPQAEKCAASKDAATPLALKAGEHSPVYENPASDHEFAWYTPNDTADVVLYAGDTRGQCGPAATGERWCVKALRDIEFRCWYAAKSN